MSSEHSIVKKLYIRAFFILNIEILLILFFSRNPSNSPDFFLSLGLILGVIYGAYTLLSPLKRIVYHSKSSSINELDIQDAHIEKVKKAFKNATSNTQLEQTELRLISTDEQENWYPNTFKLPFSNTKTFIHPNLIQKYSEQELQLLFERSLWHVKEGNLNNKYIWRLLPVLAVGIPLSLTLPTIPAYYILLAIIVTLPLSHFYGNYRNLQTRLKIEQRILDKYPLETVQQLDTKHTLGANINYNNPSLKDYGLFFFYPHIFHPKLKSLKEKN